MKDIYGKFCSCLEGEHNIFTYVDHENFGDLCEYFECRDFSSGELLWEEGDACDYAAFIISGKVEVMKQTEFKGKHVIVGIYGRGAVVGALCILDGGLRAVTAKALEDVSITSITRDNFERLIYEKPELGAQLMKGMLLSTSMRLRKSFERLATFF